MNQCDGCSRGDSVINGMHIDASGTSYMVCQEKRCRQESASRSELLPCPKCRCDDLEGSPYPADRFGNWTISCGNPSCRMFLTSGQKDTLVTVWNLVAR